MPSLGARSTWQTAHTKSPDWLLLESSFPNLPKILEKRRLLRLIFSSETMEKIKTDLSARIAEPSSNSSSTIPIAESLFDNLLEESRPFFLRNQDKNLLCFFLVGESG